MWSLTAAAGQAAPLQPTAAARECVSSEARVIGGNRADLQSTCQGAADAISFFAALELRPTHPIVIEVVPELPAAVARPAAGCYLERANRILILSFALFARNKDWFGVPIERAVYRSLAAHEVAHALAACHFAVARPTIQAKEYVAYVVTFATMDPALRSRVLRAMPELGSDRTSQINDLMLAVDPMRFGVASYRHYLRPENGAAFLRSVLAGEVLAE